MLRLCITLAVLLTCYFQGVGGSQTGGGSSSPLPVSITAENGAHLPVGVEVTLTAHHDPVSQPVYGWGAVCSSNASRTLETWNAATIKDCQGSVGPQQFTSTVSHSSPGIVSPSSGTITVTWHKPDGCDINFGPPVSKKNPNIDYCVVTVCPTYNGQKIGDCAQICAQENVRFHSTHPLTKQMDGDGVPPTNSSAIWFPRCGYNTPNGFGPVNFPGVPGLNLPTWSWKAPCLEDVQLTGDLDVTNVAVGTELGYIERYYQFSGPYCDQSRGNTVWKYRTRKLTFHLKVVQLADGSKAAIYSM